MIKYTSSRQLSFEGFRSIFVKGLDKTNKWIILADHLPWDDFARIYAKSLCEDFGRITVDLRVAIGALIIKAIKNLSDEATVEEIQENPYLQYFVGYDEFTHEKPFDPSLFVTFRKRLGEAAFKEMNQFFIDKVTNIDKSKNHKHSKSAKKKNIKSPNSKQNEKLNQCESSPPTHKGKLIIDAVVAPQDIKFPTDHDLLNHAREHTERLIDILWESSPGERKPRTYRRIARKEYLKVARKKKRNIMELRKAIRKQLGYVRRNINTIKELMNPELGRPIPLNYRNQHTFWVIQELYRQQKQMYDTKTNRVDDRIVSIAQPHVRPIIRGKLRQSAEFGPKISASLVKGYVYLDHLSWDAFNESKDLIDQVEQYKKRFGYYPESVITDGIYGTRDNRKYLNEKGIRHTGKRLGRPGALIKEELKEIRKEARIRSRIEGKFGEGKRKYSLDCVKARTKATSESWIASVFFVMNLAHWKRAYSFLSIFQMACIKLLKCLEMLCKRFASDFYGWKEAVV